jgi:hypothetical protein
MSESTTAPAAATLPTPPSPLCAASAAEDLREGLYQFLRPLLTLLDAHLDVRLVRTFLATIETIVCFRNRALGLLLSELGGYLLSPDKAPAGTKRLSNLLRSDKWRARLISDWLWQRADTRLGALEAEGKAALVLWDESVIEKPESRKAEGLCPVRSSKAKRLARSRPGPSSGCPTFVNGLHWISLLLIGPSGPPTVATMDWFTTRGENKTDLRAVQAALLKRCVFAWGRRVLHVFDRGYAGGLWVSTCLEAGMRFVVRWPKRLQLLDTEGNEKAAWQILRGQKSWEERIVWDSLNRKFRRLGLLAALVSHPEAPSHPLWLVCARPNDGKEPWLLLTSEPVHSVEAAFAIVLAYARRWQIEMGFRYNKSELAMESPRLWTWQRREKLLLMVTLCYAFLLSLLAAELSGLRAWLLRHFCHRTRKRGRRETSAPLYRLRAALSRLWMAHPQPMLPILSQNSG